MGLLGLALEVTLDVTLETTHKRKALMAPLSHLVSVGQGICAQAWRYIVQDLQELEIQGGAWLHDTQESRLSEPR